MGLHHCKWILKLTLLTNEIMKTALKQAKKGRDFNFKRNGQGNKKAK